MARKTVSRKTKRAEAEAAEKAAPKKKKKATKKKAKRKTRAKKKAASVRLKAFWGVFNQSLKRVAVFEYNEKKKAEKKARDLTGTAGKSPHFVQLVKEVIEEDGG